MSDTTPRVKHSGGCHCGRVRFEVMAPAEIEATECNCSMCGKSGFLHLIVAKSHFQLVQGGEHLTTYTFNTGVAKHFFCTVCGIKSFYVPRSNPNGYSINVRCLDQATVRSVKITQFDGEIGNNTGPNYLILRTTRRSFESEILQTGAAAWTSKGRALSSA